MKLVFYTRIELYPGLTEVQVIKRAHVLGYELIPFEGWTDAELGMPGNHGPRWAEARANRKAITQIANSLIKNYPDNTYDAVVISRV